MRGFEPNLWDLQQRIINNAEISTMIAIRCARKENSFLFIIQLFSIIIKNIIIIFILMNNLINHFSFVYCWSYFFACIYAAACM